MKYFTEFMKDKESGKKCFRLLLAQIALLVSEPRDAPIRFPSGAANLSQSTQLAGIGTDSVVSRNVR